jgi:hypothetical protein
VGHHSVKQHLRQIHPPEVPKPLEGSCLTVMHNMDVGTQFDQGQKRNPHQNEMCAFVENNDIEEFGLIGIM